MKTVSYARRALMLVGAFAALASVSALAQEARVSIASNKSFEQTIDAFKMAVSKGGMMVMSTVDQGNMLKMTGLEIGSRSPSSGTLRLGVRQPSKSWRTAASTNIVTEKHIKPSAKRAQLGEEIGWHTFRHSYSPMLRQLGVDVKVQQELLRHADIRTTMNVYASSQ